jgi:hypothetical protein
MLDTLPSLADTPAPASYHWTPALQAEFLGHLAATGSVKRAAAQVGMSPRAAHDLRHRRDGLALRIGWAAAVLIARARLEDAMLDRALFGTEESWERSIDADDGTQRVTRRRHHVQTGLAMLARLDRMAEARAVTLDARLAQLAAGDWASFLTLFVDPAFADDMDRIVETWLAARIATPDRLSEIVGIASIASEVAQISAPDAEPATAETAPQSPLAEAPPKHSVWRDGFGGWRTNFPPPSDFDGDEVDTYGGEEYSRNLTDQELAKIDARQREIEQAGHDLRREFFGFFEEEA